MAAMRQVGGKVEQVPQSMEEYREFTPRELLKQFVFEGLVKAVSTTYKEDESFDAPPDWSLELKVNKNYEYVNDPEYMWMKQCHIASDLVLQMYYRITMQVFLEDNLEDFSDTTKEAYKVFSKHTLSAEEFHKSKTYPIPSLGLGSETNVKVGSAMLAYLNARWEMGVTKQSMADDPLVVCMAECMGRFCLAVWGHLVVYGRLQEFHAYHTSENCGDNEMPEYLRECVERQLDVMELKLTQAYKM